MKNVYMNMFEHNRYGTKKTNTRNMLRAIITNIPLQCSTMRCKFKCYVSALVKRCHVLLNALYSSTSY